MVSYFHLVLKQKKIYIYILWYFSCFKISHQCERIWKRSPKFTYKQQYFDTTLPVNFRHKRTYTEVVNPQQSKPEGKKRISGRYYPAERQKATKAGGGVCVCVFSRARSKSESGSEIFTWAARLPHGARCLLLLRGTRPLHPNFRPRLNFSPSAFDLRFLGFDFKLNRFPGNGCEECIRCTTRRTSQLGK